MTDEQQEQMRKKFENKLAGNMKKMMADGFYPGTFLFPFGKVNGIIDIADTMEFPVTFGDDKYFKKVYKLRKLPLLGNYKFLLFLNRLSQPRRFFKRYIVLDGHKLDVHPS